MYFPSPAGTHTSSPPASQSHSVLKTLDSRLCKSNSHSYLLLFHEIISCANIVSQVHIRGIRFQISVSSDAVPMPLTLLLENSWKHLQLIIKQSKTFKSFILLLFVCIWMWLWMNIQSMYGYPQRSEEGFRPPEADIGDNCEFHNMSSGNQIPVLCQSNMWVTFSVPMAYCLPVHFLKWKTNSWRLTSLLCLFV